ncbi:MAG: TrmH family RNA methyltransferase [Fimbriimonas sp.]
MNEGIRTLRTKTSVRKLHKETAQALGRDVEIAIMLQDWSDGYNVGGMFRVADACGASMMIFSGRTPVDDPQIGVTSLGHHRRIPVQRIERNEEAAIWAKEQGFSLVTVEIAEGAVPYTEYEWPAKVCLVLGNEQQGVYTSVAKHRDAAVFIPMFGKGRSMNVHVSAAVVAFHVRLLGGPAAVE